MGIVAGELESTSAAVDFEHGDVVAPLIAAEQEPARRVEVEAARIIAVRLFLSDVRQRAVGADRKDADAVVQPIAGIDEFSVERHEDL